MPLPAVGQAAVAGVTAGPSDELRSPLLFHWTTPVVAKALRRGEILVSKPGQHKHRATMGWGFYLAEDPWSWSDLVGGKQQPLPGEDPLRTDLVVFRHDGRLKLSSNYPRGPYPTELIGQGFDGARSPYQVVLYNAAHITPLSRQEARSVITKAFVALLDDPRPIRSVMPYGMLAIAPDYLPPEKVVELVQKCAGAWHFHSLLRRAARTALDRSREYSSRVSRRPRAAGTRLR
ncbi:MAG: hypothetical protein H6707_17175 [Deltaproteobacteria bacterium]|nr:hypothetical protein [Deltaproteobacteria bacterium]